MILPGKFLPADRSLIVIGADIIEQLRGSERGVSELWTAVEAGRPRHATSITFDWFALALSFLFAVGAVESQDGVLRLSATPS